MPWVSPTKKKPRKPTGFSYGSRGPVHVFCLKKRVWKVAPFSYSVWGVVFYSLHVFFFLLMSLLARRSMWPDRPLWHLSSGVYVELLELNVCVLLVSYVCVVVTVWQEVCVCMDTQLAWHRLTHTHTIVHTHTQGITHAWRVCQFCHACFIAPIVFTSRMPFW